MMLIILAAANASIGPAKLIGCHLGECSWSRLVSNTVIVRHGTEALHKYVTIDGLSYHRGGTRPPRYANRVRIHWNRATTYVLCSRARPSVAFQAVWGPKSTRNHWYAHYLDLFDLDVAESSSAVTYADACHGINFNSADARKALKRLGYQAGTRNEQVDLSGPMDLLKP
jgi:hypothetical protein